MREQLQAFIDETKSLQSLWHETLLIDASKIIARLEAILAEPETVVARCAYCGKAYPPGLSTHGAETLKAHVAECPQHPMAELQKRYEALLASMADPNEP